MGDGQFVRLETTSLRAAGPSHALLHAHGQVAALAEQVAGYSHAAAGALHQLLHDMDIASQAGAVAPRGVGGALPGWVVAEAVRRSFVVPRVEGRGEWDEGAPWRAWFVQRDPIGVGGGL